MAETETPETPEFCDDCISGHLKSGTPTGTVRELGGLNTYVATPADDMPKSAVLLITDVYGWESVNSRLIADEFAKQGFLTVVPDFFQGDALSLDFLVWPPGILPRITRPISAAYQIGSILLNHGPAKTNPMIDAVLQDLRSSYPSVEKVGAQGYCWGGKYCVILGAQPGKVDAISVAHPSGLSNAEIEAIAVPSLWSCAGSDFLFNAENRKNAEKSLVKQGQTAKFVVYEGTTHGFAVRGDEKDEKVQKAATDALNEAIKLFKKYL